MIGMVVVTVLFGSSSGSHNFRPETPKTAAWSTVLQPLPALKANSLEKMTLSGGTVHSSATTTTTATTLPHIPLLFGLGAQLHGDLSARLFQEAPVNLLTSWFSGPADLTFLRGYQTKSVPAAYAQGKSLQLIVWTGSDEVTLATKYGPACGRSYPFSSSFESDMQELATIFSGSGPLYVSMFTEFQTYPCKDNIWQGNENYFSALKDQYRVAQRIFKTYAPNAQLSLTWGGWQGSWDDPGRGGGASLLPHFADVMNASDFQSFQAMDSHSNVADIKTMTRLLHGYGVGAHNKVMVAHYKPDNQSQVTWQTDLDAIFVPDVMAGLQQNGLFAFSFMDEQNINASEASYQQAKQIVSTYGQ